MAVGGMRCEGYKCEFIDSVPDVCFCKKCSLVARKLTVTSCCGMSFCYACISSCSKQGKPCPVCGQSNFTRHSHRKYQLWINSYQIYCIHKDRGCGWSGPLEQLEAHLDPDQDNCQYVDIKCPFNCQQTIPKNKVEQHVAEECVRRDFTCQHCNFKATYEEVVGKHLRECRNASWECPYSCGATLKLEMMDDHIKNCAMGVTECQFSAVGCDEKIPRQDQEEHSKQSIQKHVQLTATATVSGCQQLYNITCEQGKKQYEVNEKIQKLETQIDQQHLMLQQMKEKLINLEHQQLKYQQQEEALLKQMHKFQKRLEGEKEVQKKLGLCQEFFQHLEEKLKNHFDQHHKQRFEEIKVNLKKYIDQQQQQWQFQQLEERSKQKLDQQRHDEIEEKMLTTKLSLLDPTGEKSTKKASPLNHNFVIEHFELQIGTRSWKSPSMYTRDHGYKFIVEIDLSKKFPNGEKAMDIEFTLQRGRYDDDLNWPVRVDFSWELYNDHAQKLYNSTYSTDWTKYYSTYSSLLSSCSQYAIPLSKVLPFLHNDKLYFNISHITVI